MATSTITARRKVDPQHMLRKNIDSTVKSSENPDSLECQIKKKQIFEEKDTSKYVFCCFWCALWSLTNMCVYILYLYFCISVYIYIPPPARLQIEFQKEFRNELQKRLESARQHTQVAIACSRHDNVARAGALRWLQCHKYVPRAWFMMSLPSAP